MNMQAPPSQNVQYLSAPSKHRPSATLRALDRVVLCGWTGPGEAAQALNVDSGPLGHEISNSRDLQHGLEVGICSGGMLLLGPVEPRSSEIGLARTAPSCPSEKDKVMG